MVVRVEVYAKLIAAELMPSNCGPGEDFFESVGREGRQINPYWEKLRIFAGKFNAEASVYWPLNEET
ncbi:hypothetical protein M514_24091 [Trichuris suis]|uniref:Uncharacterized protein n=1 Tax=Trichuris suis TaxID=68888 RepID=A0A085N2P2_9BILA|nr:hypothetical protein M514_24091 [Trichuris suis]